MATLQDALTLAGQYQRSGAFAQAEQLYRQVLSFVPDQPDILCFLGSTCQAQGRLDEAAGLFQQVLAHHPEHFAAMANLASAHLSRGETETAIAAYQRAATLHPNSPEIHNNIGIALAKQGRLDDAIAAYSKALQLRPNYPEACNNLGAALVRKEAFAEAVVQLRNAIQTRPDYAEAHNNLGHALAALHEYDAAIAALQEAIRLRPQHARSHYKLGLLYANRRQFEASAACLREALRLAPHDGETHRDLGISLAKLGQSSEAVVHSRQALQLLPNQVQILNLLASSLSELEQFDEAMELFARALRLKPEDPEVRNNLVVTLSELCRWREAMLQCDEAIRLRPNYADAHLNRGFILLTQGSLAEGWPEYEWRWQTERFTPRPFVQPLWKSESLHGKTLLVHAEQGLGDTLQFVRYLPFVRRLGCRIVLECPSQLHRLLASFAEIDQFCAVNATPPAFDYHVSLLSLPGLLGTTLENMPAQVPYLQAEPGLLEPWRTELSQWNGFKIGIVWQGSTQYHRDRPRSIPLLQFAPLAQLEGVHLFSLQKGPGSEQLCEFAVDYPVVDLGSRLDETTGPFCDTAAVMKLLDLVITCDTSTAHLAGALAVPVWIALPHRADWRWFLDRDDSPWYPTARLFRQARRGDWASVFVAIREVLLAKLPVTSYK